MIVDSSAIFSILAQESDSQYFSDQLAAAVRPKISAATFVEVSIVVESRLGDGGARDWDALLKRANLQIEPFSEEQAHLARDAFSRYGKGRHSAGLNFGDCFSYALSKATGEALLCKGQDFSKTDITVMR